MINNHTTENYQEKDNKTIGSFSLSQLQSHQKTDHSPAKKHYLQLLESLGLKDGKGLLNGNKEDRICFENWVVRQNLWRRSVGIRKLSKIRAYKDMLNCIKVHECVVGLA